MPTLSDFSARTLDGREQDLGEYAGKVVLVVNTASQCGFTPQFGGLERLWDEYGDDAHPLYQWLRSEKSGLAGDTIKWNFTKFLVGRDGQVIKRFGSTTKPEKIAPRIEKALAAPAPQGDSQDSKQR